MRPGTSGPPTTGVAGGPGFSLCRVSAQAARRRAVVRRRAVRFAGRRAVRLRAVVRRFALVLRRRAGAAFFEDLASLVAAASIDLKESRTALWSAESFG